jgi:hypothetical protein
VNGWQRPRLRLDRTDPDYYRVEGGAGCWWLIVGLALVGVVALVASRC